MTPVTDAAGEEIAGPAPHDLAVDVVVTETRTIAAAGA